MIKGITRKLNEAGKIKIGKKGKPATSSGGTDYRLPEKLDHFRITTTERDGEGDLIDDIALMSILKGAMAEKTETILNSNGDIIGIPIRLLYNDTELNFPTRLASYNNGKCVCYGDGETSYNRMDEFKSPKPCPCKKYDPDYSGKDKCKANGKLTCIIDAAGMFGQAHVFRTTSINSVQGIIGGIELIKAATNGRISGLPLLLMLNAKSTTIPTTGAQTKVYVVSICYRGSMSDLQKKCLQITNENAQFLLSMDKIEKDAKESGSDFIPAEEEHDFQAEFYPESVIELGQVNSDVIDVSPVGQDADAVQEQSGSVEQPETQTAGEQASETKTSETHGKESASVIKSPNPEKIALLERLKAETDPTKAWKLIPRLDKEYLIQYLIDMHPNGGTFPDHKENKPVFTGFIQGYIGSTAWRERMGIGPDEKVYNNAGVSPGAADGSEQTSMSNEPAKPTDPEVTAHPFIVELQNEQHQYLVVKAMRDRFSIPINGTLPTDQLIELAKKLLSEEGVSDTSKAKNDAGTGGSIPEICEDGPEESEETETATTYKDPYLWDSDSGMSDNVQHMEMARLKSEQKIDKPDWVKRVNKYKDKSGDPIDKAVQMSYRQAEHFIKVLKGEEAPF
jgi:hypothetical protein